MHLYIFLGFFFSSMYNLCVIHFISGFGAGNKMIDPYVHIMSFNLFWVVVISIIKYPVFIMSMPLNILILYIILSILSYDF